MTSESMPLDIRCWCSCVPLNPSNVAFWTINSLSHSIANSSVQLSSTFPCGYCTDHLIGFAILKFLNHGDTCSLYTARMWTIIMSFLRAWSSALNVEKALIQVFEHHLTNCNIGRQLRKVCSYFVIISVEWSLQIDQDESCILLVECHFILCWKMKNKSWIAMTKQIKHTSLGVYPRSTDSSSC